jgi:hypothetical protein
MQLIYIFLKNVWQNVIQENKTFIGFLLLLITIPLSLAINNVVLIGLVITCIATFQKQNFTFSVNGFLLILFFIVSASSFFWTIDSESTLKAIPKGLILLVLPLVFMSIKPITKNQKDKIITYYSYAIVLYVLFYIIKAVIRFVATKDINVFFYHELVTKDVNAIHVSVFVAIAFFYFLTKKQKTQFEYLITLFLFVFELMLSSKNIVIVIVLLSILYGLSGLKQASITRIKVALFVSVILVSLFFLGRIKERFSEEFQSNTKKGVSQTLLEKQKLGINVVSINDAWTNKMFTPNDYFPGTAFRVYQIRMFKELFEEENVFWTGFGLNACRIKLEEKAHKYNIFLGDEKEGGYQTKNFHNQYVQNFADLGFFGFIILVILVGINLKNGIQSKDFIHIAFAVLMISLFLTESFLWRQRGVVFFTGFYCLFNLYQKKITES